MSETVIGIKCSRCEKIVDVNKFGLADTFDADTGNEKPIFCPFCGMELIGDFKEIKIDYFEGGGGEL